MLAILSDEYKICWVQLHSITPLITIMTGVKEWSFTQQNS